MCFLPYPSIPPPFSYYSAWIPLERSFGYSYSFQSIGVDRAAFHVVLFQYSPTFLALLSVDTARGLILLLFFFSSFSLFFSFSSSFFFEEHWSKLGILALLQFSSQYSPTFPVLLSVDTVKDIVLLLNFEHWSRLDAHLLFKKTEMIFRIQAIYAARPHICFCIFFPSFGCKASIRLIKVQKLSA